ncbi:MAG: hypothetical protein RBS39_09875 [Phycisphaerales bacterium]|nr:hypothetical protein [Phycisphaerales bacterium]
MSPRRPSFFGIRTLSIAACTLACAAMPAFAQTRDAAQGSTAAQSPAAYVRVEDDGRVVRLLIAAREFEPGPSGGPRVALVGAVHVGQREYYQALQDDMSAYDVVLFEGVGGGPNANRLRSAREGENAEAGDAANEDATQHDAHDRPAGDAPKGVQARLAEALGLVFQLDGIDYTRPNWRNSDMTIDEVRAELAESPAGAAAGEQIFGALSGQGMSARITNLILRFVEKSDTARQAARVFMIDVLEMSDEMLLSMPGGMGDLMRVLIVDRNEKVLTDLRAIAENEPEVKSVAVFYGAGHLMDMQSSLVERFGYTPGPTTWFTAIEADLGDQAAGIEAMRAMIRSSMQMQVEMMRRAAEANRSKEPESDRGS